MTEARTRREKGNGRAKRRDTIAGIRLTTPGRVYFPGAGITKRDLVLYYEVVAERALPGMAHRPLTLVRCPQGIGNPCFYQKRAGESVPEDHPRVRVKSGREPYTMVTGLRSLIALVQIGVLEFHVWGARADRLDRPDMVVFDLDPGPGVSWARVVKCAGRLRDWLRDLGLIPFPRVTGGKGLHLVIPIRRRQGWAAVKRFAHAAALEMVRQAPAETTARMAKAERRGKIFVDYLRNDAEATSIASYSVRARPGAPVALPLSWDEVERSRAPLRLNPHEVVKRLVSDDPWAGFEDARRPLRIPSFAREAAS